MTEWQTEPLIDCLEALIDYRGKSPLKSISGIPVLSAKVVKTAGLIRPVEQKIAPEYYAIWMTRGLPKPGDVVMTTEAPMGEIIQLDEETAQFALGQRIVCMRGKKGKLDNTFLRYLLASPKQQEILASYATGTTVLGISQKALRSIPISFPNLAQQIEIGRLLALLDDKIDLNRRMNQTLEAMARALFRDWFVDFGPTRAKMEGRPPYLAPEIWNLFPDRLDDEEKPESWGKSRIDSYIDLSYGKSLPSKLRRPGKVKVYGSGGYTGTHDTALIEGPSVIVGRKGTVGSLYWEDAASYPIDTVFYVEPKVGSMLFAYHLLGEQPLSEMNTDAAVPGLNRNNVYRLEVPTFPSKLMEEFESIVRPLWDRRSLNIRECETLRSTRDLLLPKLMSGEVRIADAEKQVTKVA